MADPIYTLLPDAKLISSLRTRFAITGQDVRYSAAQRIEEMGKEITQLRAALGALGKVRTALGLDPDGHENLVVVIMELRGRADAAATTQLDAGHARAFRWLRDTDRWPQAVHELRGDLFTAAVFEAMLGLTP